MLKKIQIPGRYFNTYYQDNALLIQFMLTEFLATQPVNPIYRVPDHYIKSSANLEIFLHSASLYLNGLLGQVIEENTITEDSMGCLTKLKNYSRQFSKNSVHAGENILPLYRTVYKAWLCALRNVEIIDVLQSPLTEITASSLAELNRELNNFHHLLSRISRDLPKIVHLFWKNENVMYFILRKRDNFIAIYGTDFIKTFFKTTLKKQEVIRLVSDNYIERGFSHLVSSF